ncbi:SAC3/GANP/THP3 [Trinorchestia longiramus]|nr:SAC3/GANP/THP3 [Trinorchestia longiramus]
MAVQGLLTSVRAAPLLAASVRYAVLQLYRMCEVSATDYNPFLDMKQLQETLAGLVRLYKDNSNHIPPQPPAFSFDLDDDDEEEYFFEFDFSTGKVRERSAGCGTNNSNGEGSCSGVSCDSNRSDAQTPGDLAGNHWTGEGSGEGECRHTCQTTSDCPDDSGFLSIDNENDRISKAAGGSFVSYRGSDDDEVSRVMTRISAMSLEAMGGEAQAASTAHVDGNSKDDKNRFNKEAGEHVKEQRECFDECVVEKDSNLYVDSPNQSTNNDDSSVNHQTNSNSNSSSLNSSEGNSNDSVTDSDKLSSSVLHESVCEREEMECIYLLLNYDKSEAVEHALELPTFVKEGKVLSRVLPAVLSYHSTGNTTALLRLLHALPPLLCSALYLSLPKLQRKILQVLTTGHSSVNSKYPLLELANQLVLPGADAARRACRHFGLTVTGDQHQFVAFHKNDFSINAPLMPLERAAWLDAKLEASGSSLLLPHPLL